MIRLINNELSLPTDVRFASIVVRGLAVGISGLHEQESAVSPFVRKEGIDRWPLDFQKKTDQVLDVSTQNLRLVKCAGDYEFAAKCPVATLLAHVLDSLPKIDNRVS